MKDHIRNNNFREGGKGVSRRQFVKLTGISAIGISSFGISELYTLGVSVISDPADPVAGSHQVQWAVKELTGSLQTQGIIVSRYEMPAKAKSNNINIIVAGSESPLALKLLKEAKVNVPSVPEALGLVPVKSGGKKYLLACGYDQPGLVYALLELADRVQNSNHPLDSLDIIRSVIERPANVIRSLNRLFVSEVEDKPWYNDREMWPKYLTLLATQRFNRFNLSLGIGYDFLQNVTDGYFLFAYPFLLSVPGYNVRVPQLPDSERDRNLEMLRFISEETTARGLRFQLGIWMHGYQWLNSPNPNYTIEGLTPETHAPYCRDALRELLKACPAISGITFRIHGESGVNEGSYDFWKTIFDGVATCGRKVEIDMHAKGIDFKMIETALATGMPVNVSPKYWGEFLGMPYHQADIRELEIPRPGKQGSGLMNLSSGSRSFTRYGYGDLMREDRRFGVLHRIWPGTQRLLVWGNPELSAAHSKAFSFCGSAGVELMEPLSFKGRRGSGIAGDRCGYLDTSLKPRWDWQKYEYSLRIFGRMTYNPDTDPDIWQRYLNTQFGPGAGSIEKALSNSTCILPIVLSSHAASAGNNTYWPEMYLNQSIPDPGKRNPYNDSPSPRVFGNVSPLDPQLFLRINDFAAELLKRERSGKYTPVEVAQWIEDYADAADKYLAQAETQTKDRNRPEYRRLAIDVSMVIGLGRFFAAKFRSGVLYGIFQQSNDRNALEESLKYYKKARGFWSELANKARDIYNPDITVGENEVIRGHWLKRLPAIDEDIAYMAGLLEKTQYGTAIQNDDVGLAINEATGRPVRISASCRHTPPAGLESGQPLNIELTVDRSPVSVRMYYRHVNQADRYESVEMHLQNDHFVASVPSDYIDSAYPLQYYFELKEGQDKAWLYPGFNADLMNQPYFVISHK
jgi:hypothetical protein